MGNNPKILCVIPARGGSKGIRNKNIKKLKKKELISQKNIKPITTTLITL